MPHAVKEKSKAGAGTRQTARRGTSLASLGELVWDFERETMGGCEGMEQAARPFRAWRDEGQPVTGEYLLPW